MRKKYLAVVLPVLILAVFLFFDTHVSAHSIARPSASSYEKYLEVIEELDVPDFYVRYEDIQVLGDFEFYVGSYNNYNIHYKFIDANGYEGSFDVYQKSFLDNSETYLTMPDNLTDMRSLHGSERGTILRGPLHYKYSNGQLLCICWVAGDVEFSVGGGGTLDDYPIDGEETIYTRLLSTNEDTALGAYSELMRDIPLQPGESIFSRASYFTIAIGAVILLPVFGMAAYVWLVRRRRRKCYED